VRIRGIRFSIAVVFAAGFAAFGLVGCDRQVAGGSTDGAAVYRAACASCHGENGKPPQAMAAQLGVRDLTGADFRARRSKELVKQQVVSGSANARMPSFKGALTEAQIDAVAAYVVTLEP
jgi:mono/diheme cytochrome c family protein